VDSIELLLPRCSLVLEDLVVRRELHGGEGVGVLAAFREEVVPSPRRKKTRQTEDRSGSNGSSRERVRRTVENSLDQSALVLVLDEVKGVAGPGLSDLLEVLLESHLDGRKSERKRFSHRSRRS
jgi:hypothetical protein